MYQDNKRHIGLIIGIIAVLLIIVAFSYSNLSQSTREDLSDESITAIRQAIERCALQCYVVEGAYPVDLAYLKNNYGLNVNEDEYYIVYDAFAQNQLPDIRVLKK